MRRQPPQPDPNSGEVIASFGEAKLIKKDVHKYELVGGSEADRAEARKWIAAFMKNDVVAGI